MTRRREKCSLSLTTIKTLKIVKMPDKHEAESDSSKAAALLVIRASIFQAVLSGISKLALALLIIFGAYKLIILSLGEDPFLMFVDMFNLNTGMMLEFVKFGFIIGFLVYIFYVVITLNLLKLEFLEDKLLYSSGIMLLHTKEIDYLDVTRINFKQYPLMKTGKITIELTGQELQSIQIPFVSNIKERIAHVKNLVSNAQLSGLSNQLYKASKGEIEKDVINKLIELVKSESFSRQNFVSEVVNISKEQKLEKDVFEVIITYMFKTHKIEKQEVVQVLVELMEEGILSKKDISDVMFKISAQGY